MLTAWRLVKTKHVDNAFDGEGAWILGGRWNSRGTRVVYCSQSLALAALELLVHLQSSKILRAYGAFPVSFPERFVYEVGPSRLPNDWRDYPAPVKLQQIGDEWVSHGNWAVLRVPSVLVEDESNYLLNPDHPDYSQIKIGSSQPFEFDSRLAKK